MKNYLLSLLLLMAGAASAQQIPAARLASGKKVYTEHCLSCHMADGAGVENMNPSLVGSSYVKGDAPKIIQVVLKGLAHQPVDGDTYQNIMPAHAFLTDKEIADVLSFVRSGWGNKGSSISEKQVKTERAKR